VIVWSLLCRREGRMLNIGLTILFTIGDMCWVKKQDKCMLPEDTKNQT